MQVLEEQAAHPQGQGQLGLDGDAAHPAQRGSNRGQVTLPADDIQGLAQLDGRVAEHGGRRPANVRRGTVLAFLEGHELDRALPQRVPVGRVVKVFEERARPHDGERQAGLRPQVRLQRDFRLEVVGLVVKAFRVRNAHEDQVVHARGMGGIDGGLALLHLPGHAPPGRPEEVGQYEGLFGARLGKRPVQVGAHCVVCSDGRDAGRGELGVGRGPGGAIHVEAGPSQSPAHVAPSFAGRVQDQDSLRRRR